jgi:hypothetical protein
MKKLITLMLATVAIACKAQLIQQIGGAGGVQATAVKGTTMLIAPVGTDTPYLGWFKWGTSTNGALFVNTSTQEVWTRVNDRWYKVTGAGSSGITSLNGLTAATQTFSTGTAGTDFGINSTGSTHTFNIPTASGSARGLLSSTDWNTFNNKQATISLTTTGNSGAATFSANTLNIPNYTLNGLGGVSGAGNGLARRFAYFTDVTNLRYASSMYYDSTNDRIGIATTSPRSRLDVWDGISTGTDGYITLSGGSLNYVFSNSSSTQGGARLYFVGNGFEGQNSAFSTTWSISNAGVPLFAGLSGTGTRLVTASATGQLSSITNNTDNIPEGSTNLYYTNTRARAAISLTTTGSSGAATYNNSTGAFNIPNYTLAGLGGFANPMTTLGDVIYGGVSGAATRLAGNTTSARQYFAQTGTGTVSAAPAWTALATLRGDVIPTFTTTGSSGAATWNSTTGALNIPNYTLAGLGGEPTIAAGTTSQYWRGDKTWQTLNTTAVTEGTNLYFTEARVRSTVLTGYTAGTNTAIAATDNILQAFGKTQGQITAREPTITAGTTAQYWRGDKTWQTLNTTAVTEGTNLYYTDGRARAAISASAPLSYNSGTGALTITQANGSTNGFLSSTDWNTFNNKQNTITNPVTGTGAAGQVGYWSTSSVMTGENELFYDAVNNRLGIGTNAPASALDVRNEGLRVRSSGATPYFAADANNGGSFLYSYNSGGTAYSTMAINASSWSGATFDGVTRWSVNGSGVPLFKGLEGTGTRLVTASNTGQQGAITNGSNGQLMAMVSGSPAWSDASNYTNDSLLRGEPKSDLTSVERNVIWTNGYDIQGFGGAWYSDGSDANWDFIQPSAQTGLDATAMTMYVGSNPANGRWRLRREFKHNGLPMKFRYRIQPITANTNFNTASVKVVIGMVSVNTALIDPDNNSIWFEHTPGTNSNNWRCRTKNSSGTTSTDTNIPVVSADLTPTEFRIDYDGTSAKFYIDRTLVATHTTNLPAASSYFYGSFLGLNQSGGNSSRSRLNVVNVGWEFTHPAPLN